MKISILQWNIWFKEDIEDIAKFLVDIKPDIVCLQELTVDYSEQSHLNTPKYVAGRLGYEYFAKEIELHGDGNLANGIFSRFPITKKYSAHINEPAEGGSGGFDDEYREYVEVAIDLGDSSLSVGTTHMSYTDRFESTKRKEQEADRLIEQIEQHKENYIFTGDLNALPGSYTINKIEEKLKNAGPPFEHNTWATKPFSYRGFVEKDLNWRLDYVFRTPDVKIISSEILHTEYSDHLPVLVNIEV